MLEYFKLESQSSNYYIIATCSLYSRRDSPAVKMEAISSSETSVLTTITRHQIPEDDFLHKHRRVNLKSYILHNLLT
jgi:hypothetical protein